MATSPAGPVKKNHSIDVIRLWQLPDNFFTLPTSEQWSAIKLVTSRATLLPRPRTPCQLSLLDDFLAVSFFLVTLGLPWILSGLWILAAIRGGSMLIYMGLATAILAFHPLPSGCRRSRLALSLIRYFSMEFLLDRDDPTMVAVGTEKVEVPAWQEMHLPIVYLACPHGVFNYGAIVWCCISRWLVGWEQNTGTAGIVKRVPGIRYMDPLVWGINADRDAIRGVLRTRGPGRQGGMIGMVPDGILGAFRTRPGYDELLIGKRRGLMRICAEEGATVGAAWFFGTTDMLTVVRDPWGLMEAVSRKIQAGVLGYYGRWFLPVPQRVGVSVALAIHRCGEKIPNPTTEQVEQVHSDVYGGLQRVYDQQKAYAGYPDRTLQIK